MNLLPTHATARSLLLPIGGALALLIAACTAATKDEARSESNAAIGEADTGFKCSAANVAMPADLPDIGACINDEAGGTGPETGCRGWTKVGPYLTTSDELRSLGKLGAQLYSIEPDTSTLCLYLYRGDRTVSVQSFNGVHCYNKTTCDVCWWDAATTMGVKPTAAILRHASDDNCSNCHRDGPLLPKYTLWEAASDDTSALHQVCAAAGGATWAQAPDTWPLRAPDTTSIVAAPSGCAGGSCHAQGFAKGGNYCQFINHAFADANGAMRGAGKKFGTKAACEGYRSDMGCVAADLDCESADIVRAAAAAAPPTDTDADAGTDTSTTPPPDTSTPDPGDPAPPPSDDDAGADDPPPDDGM